MDGSTHDITETKQDAIILKTLLLLFSENVTLSVIKKGNFTAKGGNYQRLHLFSYFPFQVPYAQYVTQFISVNFKWEQTSNNSTLRNPVVASHHRR
jgi:hypothetical protein